MLELISQSTVGGSTGGGCSLGSAQIKMKDAVYQATTDGFVITTMVGSQNANNILKILGGTTSNPTTVLSETHIENANIDTIMVPVRKDDYWKITSVVQWNGQPGTTPSTTISWMPMDCGVLAGGGAGGNGPILCSKSANSWHAVGYRWGINVTFTAADCEWGVLPDVSAYEGVIQTVQVCGGIETFSVQWLTMKAYSNNLCKYTNGKDYTFDVLYIHK